MNFSFGNISPVMSLIFGILILAFPKLINYLIAFYLIISGLIGLGIVQFT
jgi:hypothetical protein